MASRISGRPQQHPDPCGAEHLVPAAREEVAAQRSYVHRHGGRALRPVHQHQRFDATGQLRQPLDRVDGGEHVGGVGCSPPFWS